MPQQTCREYWRHEVWCGKAYPHAVDTPEVREDDDERHEEQQLTAQRKEDRLTRLSNALEEATRNHLESYNGEQQAVVAHCGI